MPATSVHKQIADAVVTAIQALSLTGITSTNVVCYWFADLKPEGFPAVIVCPIGTKRSKPYSNARDAKGYPIQVYIVDSEPLDNPSLIDAACVWREAIEDRFINQRLSSLTQLPTDLDDSPMLDPDFMKYFQKLSQRISLRFWTLEERG